MKPRAGPTAETTHCVEKGCNGALFRANDGADKIAEHFGRIVLQCDKCGVRWNVKAKPA